MKTTLKFLFILLFFVYNGNISAQGPPEMRQKYSVKGKNSEYTITVYDNSYGIRNVNNVFENVNPNYNVGMDEYLPFAVLPKKDLQRLDQVTDSIIGNCVAKTKKTWDFGDHVYISMRSDMKGKIKDVVFVLPNALSIPIEKIQALETLIKKEFTLQFKIDHRNKDAVYMVRDWSVEFEPMREKRRK